MVSPGLPRASSMEAEVLRYVISRHQYERYTVRGLDLQLAALENHDVVWRALDLRQRRRAEVLALLKLERQDVHANPIAPAEALVALPPSTSRLGLLAKTLRPLRLSKAPPACYPSPIGRGTETVPGA